METKPEPNKDSLPQAGQASAGKEGTPSPQANTYSEADVQKAINDALSKAGRTAKDYEAREAAIKASQQAIATQVQELQQWQKDREAEELAAARGDPVKLRQYQLNQTEKARKKELAEREAALATRDNEIKQREEAVTQKGKVYEERDLDDSLWEISARTGVSQVVLKDTMKDLGLSTAEQAENLAKRLATGQRPSEGEGAKPGDASPLIPASGVAIGSGKPSMEQRDKMPMDDYAALRKKEDPSLI